MGKKKGLALLTTAAIAFGFTTTAAGQGAPQYRFDVRAQDLKFALRSVTREAGMQLFADAGDLRGRRSTELHVQTTVEDALNRLLAGTGLRAEVNGKAVFIRGRQNVGAGSAPAGARPAEIVVTGSHIAGSVVPSFVLAQTQRQMIDSGQTNLGDVVRDIPQNFGGGQNPGVSFTVPTQNGENIGGGSAINLRGLGQDATLTLVNGHRRAYGATHESIDVSAIPLIAVDRIEVVPDGASAIYGSDAVAGVANVLLKRDYDGITTLGTLNAPTDGGGLAELASLAGGSRWTGGGFMLAYEYGHSNEINSDQRAFSAAYSPDLTLLPSDRHHSVVLTGHQDIADTLSFSIDALYNQRHSYRQLAYTFDKSPPMATEPSDAKSFSVTPSFVWRPTTDWTVSLQSTYGIDQVKYGTNYVFGGASTPLLRACTCNSTLNGEVNASGRLISFGDHDVRLAVGAGGRSDKFKLKSYVGSTDQVDESQRDYYEFGEINVPIIQPGDKFLAVQKLSVNLAARHESYPGIGHVTTPKVGLILTPVAGLDLKASWGKAFRAPTLYERYVATSAELFATGDIGGIGYPTGSTALIVAGGSPDLKPEKATSWSTTISIHPTAAPNLSVDVSYFHVRYRDRVVDPITYYSEGLSNPAYVPYVLFHPTIQQIESALAGRSFYNSVGGTFDPSDVVAIINDDNTNAALQKAHGVDVAIRYQFRLPGGSDLTLDANGTYLSLRERLTALAPISELAGVLYNPPHIRARAGFSWADAGITITGHLNYAGGVEDVRESPAVDIRSMTTLDLAMTYRFGDRDDFLRGVRLTATATNLFNQYPQRITTVSSYDAPYDSTNYSPVGRILSLTISKDW
ncbi:TonB-dependent receptor domain-containing protein [Sphingomonas oryzagri]